MFAHPLSGSLQCDMLQRQRAVKNCRGTATGYLRYREATGEGQVQLYFFVGCASILTYCCLMRLLLCHGLTKLEICQVSAPLLVLHGVAE